MKRLLLVVVCFLLLFAACSQSEYILDTEEEQLAAAGNGPEMVLEGPSLASALAAAAVPEPLPSSTAAPAPPAPADAPLPEPKRATLIAAGDLMCLYGQRVSARKKGKYDFNYCFAEIKENVSAADLAIGNLETLIAIGYSYSEQYLGPGNPKLNAPEEFLAAIADCGFDVMINANNHIYDYKTDGVEKTLANIDEYGLLRTGAYAKGQIKAPLIVDVRGIKIAVFGYAVNINGQPRGATMVDKYSEKLVSADMEAARAQGADFIIVYMHWGKENTYKVARDQKKQAKHIANAGADIIIGSHPHCVQGVGSIETEHGNVPVFYSLGNLISSATLSTKRESALVNIVIEKDSRTGETVIAALTYTPALCTSTSAGRNIILPADLEYISRSGKAKALLAARKRIIKVMGDAVARPE
jgi:poly-gamma-glutamate synthesis protein (capsule biosynthesis protein)